MRMNLISVCVTTLAALLSLPCKAEVIIDQVKEKFTLEAATLKVGDNAIFKNSDPVKHNLTVMTPDEEAADLGMEAPGATVKYRFEKAGIYDVRCSIHPRMKIKIKVE